MHGYPYPFILRMIAYFSLIVLIYIFVRAAVRKKEEINLPKKEIKSLGSFEILEKMDKVADFWIEKILRRARLILMKINNKITLKLQEFKTKDRH